MPDTRQVSVLHLHLGRDDDENSGQHHHRVLNPIRVLRDEPGFAAAEISWHHPQALLSALAADILVIHALAGVEIEALIRERRQSGRTTLFEIADHLSAALPWRRQGPVKRDALVIGRQLLHASLADGLQFSSPGLAEIYAEVNQHRAVIDNIVEFPAEAAQKPPGFVFGWAGTRSHRADLATVAPAIKAFCARHTDAAFALMGDPDLASLFDGLPPAQLSHRPFGSYHDYRRFLAGLHLGVVPLSPSRFNTGRSDVKLVEMAAESVVVLAQDAPPYRPYRDSVDLFHDAAGLDALLETHYREQDALAARAAELRTAIEHRRGLAAVRAQHVAWYRAWVSPGLAGPQPEPDAGLADLAEALLAAGSRGPADLDRIHGALLAVQPYHYFALAAEIRRHERAGRAAEAAPLKHRFALVSPEALGA